jgi:hypothetical protein
MPPISVFTRPPIEIAPGTIVFTVVFSWHFPAVHGMAKMDVNSPLMSVLMHSVPGTGAGWGGRPGAQFPEVETLTPCVAVRGSWREWRASSLGIWPRTGTGGSCGSPLAAVTWKFRRGIP